MGQDGGMGKQVFKEVQAEVITVRTEGCAEVALAQEQIWHDQQQEQAGPCLKHEPFWDDLVTWGYQIHPVEGSLLFPCCSEQELVL